MAVLANRVKMSTSTIGTGTIDLDAAETGYQSFADGGITNGQVVSYAIEEGAAWEVGTGTYTTGTPDTLSRTVVESSNSGAPINLTGSAVVFITALASDLQNSVAQYEYTATAGQTTFSGADDNAATLSYTVANLIVTLNGVVLDNGGDYTATNGTSVVLASGAAAGDLLQVIAFKSFTVADMVPASTGGTFAGNVTVTGDVLIADKLVHDGDTNTAIRFPAADTVTVETAGSERVRVDSSGDVLCGSDGGGDIGSSTKRFKDLYLSGGVVFGATGGSVTSKTLDDYEEGTWTPSFRSGFSGTPTYVTRGARYTKIGRMVYCDFYMRVTGTGDSSQLQVDGLPFPSTSNNLSRGGGLTTYVDMITGNTMQFYGGPSISYFSCYINGNAAPSFSGSITAEYLIGIYTYETDA